MSEDSPKVTREGLFEDLAGKAKEKVGEVLGNDELAEEGRREQEHAEAPEGEPVTTAPDATKTPKPRAG